MERRKFTREFKFEAVKLRRQAARPRTKIRNGAGKPSAAKPKCTELLATKGKGC